MNCFRRLEVYRVNRSVDKAPSSSQYPPIPIHSFFTFPIIPLPFLFPTFQTFYLYPPPPPPSALLPTLYNAPPHIHPSVEDPILINGRK